MGREAGTKRPRKIVVATVVVAPIESPRLPRA
jgi:hypothetical protein